MGHGNPPRSTADQVLVPAGAGGYGYYWTHVCRAYLGSLYSLDLATGAIQGRLAIPGRNLWDVDNGRGHLYLAERDRLLLLRSELGPVVLGASALRPASALRERLARLPPAERSPAQEREMDQLRESANRHHRPFLGCEKVSRAPFLDGEFDDWQGAAWTELSRAADFVPADGGSLAPGQKRWGGPGDSSARFAVRHDGGSLYLAVEVRDDDFSPPAGTGFLTPGDSVEVGLSLGGVRADALAVDVDSWHPDIKVLLALVDGKPTATPVWFGSGSEVAISVRPGTLRYEAAIPFRHGRIWPANPAQIGFALRVNDVDGGKPKGALSWAGGLGAVNSAAEFGSLNLAPLSAPEFAERRRAADLLPDAALAWELLFGLIETRLAIGQPAAAAEEVKGFLERHPQSHHASKCLAWYEHLLGLAGEAEAAAKAGALAGQLKVPALEREEAALRVFAKVKLPPGRRPRCLGLSFNIRGLRWQERYTRGVYWGEPRGLIDGGLIYAGELPAGESLDLSVPAELLELVNKTVESASFHQLDGQAWWGEAGLVDASGAAKTWVEAGAQCAERGSNWQSGKAPDGSSAHFPADFGLEWSSHSIWPVKALALANANAKLESEGGKLDKAKCLEAAVLMPESRLALELLNAVGDANEVAGFVRRFPAGPLVPDLLRWLADRAGKPALAEELIAEGRLAREFCRSYYAGLPGIAAWQVVGPFSNEADVALRRDCGPESRPELAATYRDGEQELRWKEAKADRGQVDFAKVFSGGNFQAAYAAVWVRAAEARRAWVFIDSPNAISLWNGSERILENAVAAPTEARSRRTGGLEAVPITLAPGWNRLLVKDCGRWGYWGFKLRLGAADGAPLKDIEYGTTEPPAAVRPAG